MKSNNQDSQMHCPPEWEDDRFFEVTVTLTTLVNCEDEDTARQEVERDLFAGDIEDWQVEEVWATNV